MISVVIRSHNDAPVIRRTIEMLLRQRDVVFELLSFDDSSTDGTQEILAEYPAVRKFAPVPGPYNPAAVLNRAVAECSGEIVVFNNSDAVPESESYLTALTAPFADPEVGAVFGAQDARPDAELWVRSDYEHTFGAHGGAGSWPGFFSLVSSAARRALLERIAFDPAMQYSEDIDWAARVRRETAFKIAYAPAARVEHSHNYRDAEIEKRFKNEAFYEYRILGTRPSRLRMLRRLTSSMLRDLRYGLSRGAGVREILRAVHARKIREYAFEAGLEAAAREVRR